ncbi:MAG: hypothetical protein MJH10_09430 [Epibacterium sp.]|nr:hypothetical protein [Epibacterium sp.]NQX73757.1 hypothetical protein [Epibacterium sp.]
MASINQSIRIYPGMWQDTKLSVIADQTGMSVAAVFGCLACMMSMSGASENRGKFAVTPVELADTMGIGLKQAEAVIFHVKRFFVSRGWWRHWDALQVKREDRSAARVRKHRGKNQGVTSEKTPKETVTYNADGQSSFLTESVTSQKTPEETTTCDGSSRAPTRVEYNNINYNINNNFFS